MFKYSQSPKLPPLGSTDCLGGKSRGQELCRLFTSMFSVPSPEPVTEWTKILAQLDGFDCYLYLFNGTSCFLPRIANYVLTLTP